jgi:hypothetical protein
MLTIDRWKTKFGEQLRKTGAMVERYAHVASKALQGAAARLDAMTGYVAATPEASPESPTA